jgi:hypothetical protein
LLVVGGVDCDSQDGGIRRVAFKEPSLRAFPYP